MPTIFPTGSCFDDALEYLAECCRSQPAGPQRFRLVHAICVFPADHPQAGQLFAHAWVEEDAQLVHDFGILHGERVTWTADRDEVYAQRPVIEATYYCAAEAWFENHRTGHYGPWKPAYQSLCGRTMGAKKGAKGDLGCAENLNKK